MKRLPPEIVELILGEVNLTDLSTISPSTLNDLHRCSDCYHRISTVAKCTHLHHLELEMAYKLRLVCSSWNQIICAKYGNYTFWKPTI
jgi:hypothetical protein